MTHEQPQFHPISMLPIYTEMIDGMMESAVEQLASMRLVADKPHILDDETVERFITLHTEQLEDHWILEEQLARWRRSELNMQERTTVNRLTELLPQLKEHNEQILKKNKKVGHATINKILAMDDGELGLAVLTGKIKPPF